jgi:hypothetical protein
MNRMRLKGLTPDEALLLAAALVAGALVVIAYLLMR